MKIDRLSHKMYGSTIEQGLNLTLIDQDLWHQREREHDYER